MQRTVAPAPAPTHSQSPATSARRHCRTRRQAGTTGRTTHADVRVPAADRIGAAGSGWSTWHEVMLDGIIMLGTQSEKPSRWQKLFQQLLAGGSLLALLLGAHRRRTGR